MAKADDKNIVIIGGKHEVIMELTSASFAGHALANELATRVPPSYRILLIDGNEFAVHLPAVVRALVVPGYEERKLTAPLNQSTVFPAGSRHRVVRAVVVELREGSVLLDLEFEGAFELPFAKCVLATGASQPPPIRPSVGCTLETYRAELRAVQEGFARSESILIVGGGAVGVEVAGELTSHYPSKNVTLVHSRERPLATAASDRMQAGHKEGWWYKPIDRRVGERLERQLRVRGVDLHLGDRVVFPTTIVTPSSSNVTASRDITVDADEEKEVIPWTGETGSIPLSAVTLRSGVTVIADYVFMSTGNAPNSSLVSAIDPSAVTKEGYVRVDDTLAILSPLLPNCFALGDVASVPGRKTAQAANVEALAFGKMLAASLHDAERDRQKRRTFTPYRISSVLIPLGDGRGPREAGVGAGALDLAWFGTWMAPAFLLRWFAADYLFKQTFLVRFVGEKRP